MQEMLYLRHPAPVESSGENGGGGSTLARGAYHQSAMNFPAFTCHQGLPSCVKRGGPGAGKTPIFPLIEIYKTLPDFTTSVVSPKRECTLVATSRNNCGHTYSILRRPVSPAA